MLLPNSVPILSWGKRHVRHDPVQNLPALTYFNRLYFVWNVGTSDKKDISAVEQLLKSCSLEELIYAKQLLKTLLAAMNHQA